MLTAEAKGKNDTQCLIHGSVHSERVQSSAFPIHQIILLLILLERNIAIYLFAGAHFTGGLNVTCSVFTHIIHGVFIFFSHNPTGLIQTGFEGKAT